MPIKHTVTTSKQPHKNKFPLPLFLGFFLFIISLLILVRFRSQLNNQKNAPEFYPISPSTKEVDMSLSAPSLKNVSVSNSNIKYVLPVSVVLTKVPNNTLSQAFAFVVKVPKPLKVDLAYDFKSRYYNASIAEVFKDEKDTYTLYQVVAVRDKNYTVDEQKKDPFYLQKGKELLSFNVFSYKPVKNAKIEFVTIKETQIPSILDQNKKELLSDSYKQSFVTTNFVPSISLKPLKIEPDIKKTPNVLNNDGKTYNGKIKVVISNPNPAGNVSYCISTTNNCPLGYANYKGPFDLYPGVSFKGNTITGPNIYVLGLVQQGSELNNLVSNRLFTFKVSEVYLKPEPGSYLGPLTIKASTFTPKSAIYYGNTQDIVKTPFPSAGLLLNKSRTLYLRAAKKGYLDSVITKALYKIKTSKAPKVSFLNIKQGDLFALNKKIDIQVKVFSSIDISKVVLYANGNEVASLTKPLKGSFDIYSFSYTPKKSGDLTLKVVAFDTSLNKGIAETTVKVFNLPLDNNLSFDFAKPKDKDKFVYLKDNIVIALTNVKGVPKRIQGILGNNYTFSINKNTYAYSISLKTVALPKLQNGYNTLKVTFFGPNNKRFNNQISVFIYTGDINADNKVDIQDLLELVKYILSAQVQSNVPKKDITNYDANMDGVVNINDVVAFINILFN